MTKQEIQEEFSKFIKRYDAPAHDALWQQYSKKFNNFLEHRIFKTSQALTEAEVDEIVLLLDKKGRGSSSETQAVAIMMIPMGKWSQIFENLKADTKLAQALKNVFEATTDANQAAAINAFYALNGPYKNKLTGRSGNGINGFLALHDPAKYSFAVAIDARAKQCQFFGFALPTNFQSLSVGEQCVITNRALLNGFRDLGIDASPRTLNQFVYQESLRTQWENLNGGFQQAGSGNHDEENENELDDINKMDKSIALNQILFGPPGTGKTYHTVNEAIKIVDPEYYNQHQNNRDKLKERFRDLLIKDWKNPKGQIAFCTFHQSFSYEDFVEGIKPVAPEDKDTYLKYDIEDGIFKRICQLARDTQKSVEIKKDRLISWTDEEFRKASFYKISLGDINYAAEDEVYDYCIKNNRIAVGFSNGVDFTGLDEEQVIQKGIELKLSDHAIRVLNRFINILKTGNYVIVSKGNRYVRAIGKVTGEYKFDLDAPEGYYNTRTVEWILKDESIPIEDVYDRNLIQKTLYKIDEEGIKKDFFVNSGTAVKIDEKVTRNFALIIDEINRGNVSSIFGELITLIEKDKRVGGDEVLEVTLPYSKEPFKVPGNVYLIGTMNTADRSIEALDTALRRRFSFTEMPARPELIKTEGRAKGKLGDIDLIKMLEAINQRIEKLIDKDHKIGHAYFMEVNTIVDLKDAFENKVIPLLQEYFFGDFGKIGLVLGDSFVEQQNNQDFSFATFKGYDEDGTIADDLKNRPMFKIKDRKDWNFISIYE